jgi:hypothetical protein
MPRAQDAGLLGSLLHNDQAAHRNDEAAINFDGSTWSNVPLTNDAGTSLAFNASRVLRWNGTALSQIVVAGLSN